MDLKRLSELVGLKSASDMTDEELREHIRELRKSRMTSKGAVKTSKASKTGKKEELSQEQIRQLLAALEE